MDSSSTQGRHEINFSFQNCDYRLEVSEGIELHSGKRPGSVSATYCRDGRCVVDLHTDSGHAYVRVPYSSSHNDSGNNTLHATTKSNSSNSSDNATSSSSTPTRQSNYSSSTNYSNLRNRCNENVSALGQGLCNLHTGIASDVKGVNLSHLSASHRPTITLSDSNRQYAWSNSFFMFSSLQEPPQDYRNDIYGSFSSYGGSGGKNGYCDPRTGNCHGSSGSSSGSRCGGGGSSSGKCPMNL